MAKGRKVRDVYPTIAMTPPSPKEMERMAAEHVVDVKTRNHPHVKKIRDRIMDEVLKAGNKVSLPRRPRG